MTWAPVASPPPASAPQYAYGQGGAGSSGGSASPSPAFRAYQSSSQSAPTGTVIQYQTEDYDTDAAYDASTGRFQPATPGYYHLTASWAAASGYTTSSWLSFYKNGALHTSGMQPATLMYRFTVSGEVYLDGVSDYVDVRLSTGETHSGAAGSASIYFSGFMARPA